MNLKYMIYLYVVICISLVIFELLWLASVGIKTLYDKRKTKKIYTRMSYYCTLPGEAENSQLYKKDRTLFIKSLSSQYSILSFAKAFELIAENNPEGVKYLMERLTELALPVSKKMRKSNNSVIKTYFAVLLYNCTSLNNDNCPRNVIENLLSILRDDSVFCRINALRAISLFGKPSDVLHAALLLDENGKYLHRKLLTDTLCIFRGERRVLALLFCRDFDKFSEEFRIAIIEYFTVCSPEIGEFLTDFLSIKEYSVDVICATIRYYRKYPFDGVYDILSEFVINNAKYPWEIVAVTASALSSYDKEPVKEILKSLLGSKYWFVRRNAANSLVKIGLSIKETADILYGEDKYAGDILKYSIMLTEAKEDVGSSEVNKIGTA